MDNTILFGNGINRLISNNISWEELLDKIKDKRKFKDDLLPNTMIYERILLERLNFNKDILEDEFEVKEEISLLLQHIKSNEIYIDIFNSEASHFITTNYDYGFIDSIKDLPEINLPIEEFSIEDVYSIRRLKEIKNKRQLKKNFWQIHGEIRKPATIMLGLDHYCGSIAKINNYIKGLYQYQKEGKTVTEDSIKDKFINKSFNNSSWIELFFISNIHIIGFNLDYCEIDLWWVITKRARMKKDEKLKDRISNEIHFYCNEINEQKKSLLESMYIIVHILELPDSALQTTEMYLNHYRELINKINRNSTISQQIELMN
jgi:hypothetical protein